MTKLLLALLPSALLFCSPVQGGGLRQSPKSTVMDTNTDQQRVHNFVPLDCNQQFTKNTTWTDFFGSDQIRYNRVLTIPCGVQVEMDFDGPRLLLRKGLEIQGKLTFPENPDQSLTILAPHIAIYGELEILATSKPVDGQFMYKFEMIGHDDHYLKPMGENVGACTGNQCNVGKKVIAVAGGKLNGTENYYYCRLFFIEAVLYSV